MIFVEKKKGKKNLKFSAVLGTMSAKSSILMRPAGMDPMVTSKKTMGFLGLGGLRCHSDATAGAAEATTTLLLVVEAAPPEAIAA